MVSLDSCTEAFGSVSTALVDRVVEVINSTLRGGPSSFSFRLVRCHAYGATASIPVGSRGSLSLCLQIIVAVAHTSIVGGTRGMLTVPQI